ncbi:MAG: DUF1893 domain-containing protein [Sphaerochaetaceae bacterium]
MSLQWFEDHKLPADLSLVVFKRNGEEFFRHSGKWLYPLLALQDYLLANHIEVDELLLHDRITGRAAAALTILIGFKTVKADILSELAIPLFEKHGVHYYCEERVARITCQTEHLITPSMDLAAIYAFITERIAKN